jgi:hypothetical protein
MTTPDVEALLAFLEAVDRWRVAIRARIRAVLLKRDHR